MPEDLETPFFWALALAIAFPVVSVTLAEVALRLQRAGRPLAAPVGLVRDLILPALAALVLLTKVIGWQFAATPVRLVQTVFWLFVVNAALSFLNAVLFAGARKGTWQEKMPRLFVDMTRGLIVLICLAVVLSVVWGQDLGKMVAALGVGSLVFGLALQEPVGNFFNGIMLMMERPIGLGDWVKIGDNVGKVVESNWRSVHLRTSDINLVVVPNSMLAKGMFINFTGSSPLHKESVRLHFSCDDPPNKVKLVLLEAARRTSGVVSDPPPKVRLHDFGESRIEYEVKLPTLDFANVKDLADEFRTLVWYAARREGLTMPYPIHTHLVVPQSTDKLEEPSFSPDTLNAFPHLGLSGADGPGNLSGGTLRQYARGEQVVKEGQRLHGLHLIVAGKVVLSASNGAGHDVEIARLERGEFFGEKSILASAPSDATGTALEDLEVLVLDSASVSKLIEQTPYFSQQIGGVMESRRRALQKSRSEESRNPV